jgi:membrane fusion protein, multidrug efflux system
MSTEAPATALQRARKPLLILGPVLAIALAGYFYLTGGRFEGTDDAYVMTARVAISSNISGRVTELNVRDNQRVHAGDILYRLDETPLRISVAEAEAQLSSATLEVNALKANYLQRKSELASAGETLAFQTSEYERYSRLLSAGISSQSQVDGARHALDEARSRAASIEHEVAAVVAQLGGNPQIELARHPLVQRAQSALDRAHLNLSYTVIRAPSDGVVTRVEQLQVGSYVAASTPVFALVSTDDVWIEANFKEDQLAHMQVGQHAAIKIDSYPGKTFDGRVVSVSPGTGSQFSALPAENATGNWVKVVQRLPVRIELNERDDTFALHGGLSAVVDVDTRYQRRLFGANEQLPEETTTASR